jgi:hypothetical protein
MATTSPFSHINEKLGIVGFCPEVTQGTPNYKFTASGGSTTTVTVDVTAGTTHDANIATAPDDFFNELQVYFIDGNEAENHFDVTDFAVSGSTATFTLSTMTTGPSASDEFFLLGMLPASDVSHSETPEDLERTFVRNSLDGPSSKKGLEMCTSSYRMEMHGLANASADATAASEDRLSKFLACIGTRSAGDGDTVQASPSPTTGGFTVADGGRFSLYDWIMVNGELTQITGISTNALTVSPGLSAAPSASDVVYQAEKFTPDDSGHQTHTMLFLTDDRLVTHRGCVFSPKVTVEQFGALVYMELEADAEDYLVEDAIALDASLPSSYSCVKFTNTAGCYFGSTELYVNSFEFDMAHGRQELRDTNAGLRFDIRSREAQAGVVFRDTGKTPKTSWENSSTLAELLLSAGNSAGSCFAVAGQAQLVEAPHTNNNDTRYWDATFRYRDEHDSKTRSRKPLFMRF